MAKKTINVGKKNGKPNPPGETRARGGKDTVVLKNRFGAKVRWVVPAGPFKGGAVDEVVEKGKKSEKKTKDHNATAAYVYKVLEVQKRGKVKKKRRLVNDPVIIIDP